MEGHDPPGPRERAAALLANGLVAWSRRDLAEAQKLARDARALALDAELGHELGEASTLLALISYATGTWHELFRNEFADSVRRGPELEMAVFDAHLCFQEFYLHGSDGHEGADRFAHELLELANQADSKAGRALAALLLGEFALLSGSLDRALEYLREAARWAEQSGCVSAHSIALERLAETEVLRGNVAVARSLLREALPIAEASGIPSHLVIRVFGVGVLAAETTVDRLRAAVEGERWITDASRVCEPCSMTFRIEATRAFARAGVLQRARIHLAEAERITGLWQGGPWTAAIWEARAEVRRAEGDAERARALFLEASQRFGELNRPLDEARCLAAADLAG
jgi:tetratricopeptide (TPR) repeat protein